jgi:hypothetical protein
LLLQKQICISKSVPKLNLKMDTRRLVAPDMLSRLIACWPPETMFYFLIP